MSGEQLAGIKSAFACIILTITMGVIEKPHKKLDAWKEAIAFVEAVYSATNNFPRSELYGLTAQMRRAAVSVPSNIAEGAADRTGKQFTNFLSMALGSLNELDTQLVIASRIGYLDQEAFNDLSNRIDRVTSLVYGLRKSTKKQANESQ